MGYYIDPPKDTKEAFLTLFGEVVDRFTWLNFNFDDRQGKIPVCLMDNGMFTAAGIAYHSKEAEVFAAPDGRPKRYFLVKDEDLIASGCYTKVDIIRIMGT